MTPKYLAKFPVTLQPAATQEVTVDYETVDGTAIADVDYNAVTGQLVFAPGETQKTIEVGTRNILIGDPAAFSVRLLNPSGAVLVGGHGSALIEGGPVQVEETLLYDEFTGAAAPLAGRMPDQGGTYPWRWNEGWGGGDIQLTGGGATQGIQGDVPSSIIKTSGLQDGAGSVDITIGMDLANATGGSFSFNLGVWPLLEVALSTKLAHRYALTNNPSDDAFADNQLTVFRLRITPGENNTGLWINDVKQPDFDTQRPWPAPSTWGDFDMRFLDIVATKAEVTFVRFEQPSPMIAQPLVTLFSDAFQAADNTPVPGKQPDAGGNAQPWVQPYGYTDKPIILGNAISLNDPTWGDGLRIAGRLANPQPEGGPLRAKAVISAKAASAINSYVSVILHHGTEPDMGTAFEMRLGVGGNGSVVLINGGSDAGSDSVVTDAEDLALPLEMELVWDQVGGVMGAYVNGELKLVRNVDPRTPTANTWFEISNEATVGVRIDSVQVRQGGPGVS